MSEDIAEKSKQNVVTLSRYALYAYDATKEIPKNSEEVGEGDGHSEISAENEKSFSLSILATNLDAEKETSLRSFLSKRLSRNMLVEGAANGNVSSMDFCLDESSTAQAVCYSSLLKKMCIDSTTSVDDQFECVDTSKEQLYIVCLLTVANGILDFFKPELSSYHEALVPLLDPGLKQNLNAVQEYLNDWFDSSLSYICRCVSRLGKDVDKILQLCLSGGALNIQSQDDLSKADLKKFYESCSLTDFLSTKSNENPLTLDIKLNSSDYVLQGVDECCEYCKKWASSLVENNNGDPLVLKRIIEDFKLKTVQDMNCVKRMIRQAENDHYALFRMYSFIANSGYGGCLIQHAKYEESVNNNSSALDVISVVEDFIIEHHQSVST